MSFQLFNSLTRQKENFAPKFSREVLLYVCGITPNNATHLGHAFTYVSFDILVRYLKYKGYSVNYLQNATDINDSDDVIKQAKLAKRTWKQEATHWIKHFHKQMDSLNVLRPDKYILATSVMDEIIIVISDLLKKELAYENGGNIYFNVETFKNYGKLSHMSKDQMLKVPVDRGTNTTDPLKKNPLDFVLWFGDSKKPNWKSPWGNGRPGWHIECSTMIYSKLGPQIDIHGGGEDLIYPHHESEIAQSESNTGKSPFAKVWMHTAYVLFEGEKMSKSLGNLVLVENLLKKYSPNTIRWLLLSHHYRTPWEYSEKELREVDKKVLKIESKLSDVKSVKNKDIREKFEKLMEVDLNTPKVLDLVEQLIIDKKSSEALKILKVLGFNI